MPAVLVECGIIVNRDEETALADPDRRARQARASPGRGRVSGPATPGNPTEIRPLPAHFRPGLEIVASHFPPSNTSTRNRAMFSGTALLSLLAAARETHRGHYACRRHLAAIVLVP
jgi:hypothetical protein